VLKSQPLKDDVEFVKQFPLSPGLTDIQLAQLHAAILKQRHTGNVWSENDWDIGTAPVFHQAHLKPGSKPVKLRPYRVNAVKEAFMHRFLTELVQAGVLKVGSSPWGFPLIMTKKPGRDRLYLSRIGSSLISECLTGL
jgi:hypothetical protein